MAPNRNKKKSNQRLNLEASVAEEGRVVPPVYSAGGLVVEQNREMARQDEELEALESSVNNLREASVAINGEVSLHNRLLGDLHSEVDSVQDRQLGTTERMRNFLKKSSTWKLWMLIIFLGVVLVLIIVVLN
jgi:hypothetical protein